LRSYVRRLSGKAAPEFAIDGLEQFLDGAL